MGVNVEHKDETLALSFYNLAGKEILAQREFGKDDSVDKLQAHIRDVLAAAQMQFFNLHIFDGAGSLVDGGFPIGRFTSLTARGKDSSIAIVNLLQDPVTARFY